MSLVGSLEDLGLGDILQIVSLSQKSGLLLLRSEAGEGRIIFRDGTVRGAFVKGSAEDLRQLVVGGGFLAEEVFDRTEEEARATGAPLEQMLDECAELPPERLDSLRREHVERAVFEMFSWRRGEFSFEVRSAIEERDTGMLLETGISAQFVIMEATRLGDETIRDGDHGDDSEDHDPAAGLFGDDEIEPAESDLPEVEGCRDEALVFSGEATGGGATDFLDFDSASDSPREDPTAEVPAWRDPHEAVAVAAAERIEAADGTEAAEAPAPSAPVAPAPRVEGLIVVDTDLAALEWVKTALRPLFTRIHIFQRCDAAVSRLRQYLGRGDTPALLISPKVLPDPLTGARDVAELAERLRGLAPQMPLLVLQSGDEETGDVTPADAVVSRPAGYELSNRRRWPKLEGAASTLRDAVSVHLERPAPGEPSPSAPPASPETLQRLKQISDRMRDPSARGEVLSLVLDFASGFVPRVAIFMVREDAVVGVAQIGLSGAGGPSDEEFRALLLPADGPACFRAVAERRAPFRGPLDGPGDAALVESLGGTTPAEAYVAPIESGDDLVALIYADRLPDRQPIGDTTVIEIALQEAGLALERTVLERALAESRGPGPG